MHKAGNPNPSKPFDGGEATVIAASKGGRSRQLLDEKRLAKVLELIRAGNYMTVAGRATGITERTFWNYMQRGQAVVATLEGAGVTIDDVVDAEGNVVAEPAAGVHVNDWLCFRLMLGCDRARAEAEGAAVLHVRKAWGDSWQAAMTWLERTGGDRWRRRETVEIGPAGDAESLREQQVLDSPDATHLMHEALRRAATDTT